MSICALVGVLIAGGDGQDAPAHLLVTRMADTPGGAIFGHLLGEFSGELELVVALAKEQQSGAEEISRASKRRQPAIGSGTGGSFVRYGLFLGQSWAPLD